MNTATQITLEDFGTMYQVSKDSFCLTYQAQIIIEGLTADQATQALTNLAKLQEKKWEEYNNYIEEKYQIPTIKEYFNN